MLVLSLQTSVVIIILRKIILASMGSIMLGSIPSASRDSVDSCTTLDDIITIKVQNNIVNSGIMKVANQITILFIMAFTCRNQGIFNIQS